MKESYATNNHIAGYVSGERTKEPPPPNTVFISCCLRDSELNASGVWFAAFFWPPAEFTMWQQKNSATTLRCAVPFALANYPANVYKYERCRNNRRAIYYRAFFGAEGGKGCIKTTDRIGHSYGQLVYSFRFHSEASVLLFKTNYTETSILTVIAIANMRAIRNMRHSKTSAGTYV